MTRSYNLKDIKLGHPKHSGHVGYPDAIYDPSGRYGKPFKIIVKENKHGDSQFSRLEVAFSQLAGLFLASNSTPFQKIVVDDSNAAVGLAVQHLCYVIEKKEGLNQSFYQLGIQKLKGAFRRKNVSTAEDIPLYFLDRLPHEFFANLLQAEKDKRLTIDYASLASIFVSSYSLEEDDLHKGNFGFYLIEKNGKPMVTFFKIDHDLMFVDSIMSFYSVRFFHWLQAEKAFDVTADDLLNFPNLEDSANSYWPTKKCYIPNFVEDKEFRTDIEVESFASLAKIPEFNQAKWTNFYKHILLPSEIIKQSLCECLDENIPEDRAQIALITQAVAARQARLRAVLFSLKEFQDFVREMSDDEKESLLQEVIHTDPRQKATVLAKMNHYYLLCNSEDGFDVKDTPLHISIKLEDYRYEETMQIFGRYVNHRNASGKCPLDVAVDNARTQKPHSPDIRQDARFTMKSLLEHGARKTKTFKRFDEDEHVEIYQFKTHHLDKALQANDYQDLKNTLRDVGEDISFCLKFKKNLAIECIGQFIKSNQNNPNLKTILIRLRSDMNGDSSESEAAPLKYIRQLRSKLWIIRQIRGLYGNTSTQDEINGIIDNELERLKPKSSNCFSFFFCDESSESEVVESGMRVGKSRS